MTGRALIEPVDDIPLAGPFPAAMEILADDFIRHDFDYHRLIRVIAQTQTFRRSSEAAFEITEQHLNSGAAFPMRRLRPDQVSSSIIQSTSLTPLDASAHILNRLLKFGQELDFIKRYGDPGENEFEVRGETVTQRLLMLNGKMIDERIEGGFSAANKMASLAPDPETAIEAIFLSTLTRRPTDDEMEYFLDRIEPKTKSEQNQLLQDLYWTLINSLEFSWNR